MQEEIEEYSVYSEFDYQKHKDNFTHYLEVIVLPTGQVKYAVPSHQEFLIRYGMKLYHKSRSEFEAMCPEEYYANYLTWLCKMTKCVVVWTNGYYGNPNRFQQASLDKMKKIGIGEWD